MGTAPVNKKSSDKALPLTAPPPILDGKTEVVDVEIENASGVVLSIAALRRMRANSRRLA